MTLNPTGTDWTRPAQYGFSITPGASPLEHATRGINVAVSGTVTVTFAGSGDTATLYLAAGVIHPLNVTHVTAATATGIVGLY
jgi:hypothetical protein